MAKQESPYESPTAYDGARIRAAAVYCSDGRVGDQIDDFLHRGLGLPRYDRLAVPGGPVCLSGRLGAYWEARGTEEQLRFLIKAHEIEHLVLLAHEGCAYYLGHLGISESALDAEQRHDLREAASLARKLEPALTVRAFIARRVKERIRFEAVVL